MERWNDATIQRLNVTTPDSCHLSLATCHASQGRMRSIAERRGAGMLAAAPGDGLCFGDVHFFRREAGAFVRAVAKGLALGTPAGAPPISAGLGFLYERRFLGDC